MKDLIHSLRLPLVKKERSRFVDQGYQTHCTQLLHATVNLCVKLFKKEHAVPADRERMRSMLERKAEKG